MQLAGKQVQMQLLTTLMSSSLAWSLAGRPCQGTVFVVIADLLLVVVLAAAAAHAKEQERHESSKLKEVQQGSSDLAEKPHEVGSGGALGHEDHRMAWHA